MLMDGKATARQDGGKARQDGGQEIDQKAIINVGRNERRQFCNAKRVPGVAND